MKISSAIQKLIQGGGDTQKHRQHGDRISLYLFFGLKTEYLFSNSWLEDY
jgi:hypothetical protein